MRLALHPNTLQKLDAITKRPARCYLFYGPNGVGKRQAAIALARTFNCPGGGDDNCQNCNQIDAGNFPDLLVVTADQKIGIASILQLQKSLDLATYSADGRRVVIIDASNGITTEAQNCMLKLLEEPPFGSFVTLIGQKYDQFLPTVLSRVQPVHFPLLDDDIIQAALQDLNIDSQTASRAVELAMGRVGRAIEFASSPDLLQQYGKYLQMANDLVGKSLHQRLQIIATASDDTQWSEVSGYMLAAMRLSVRQGIKSNIGALERFYRHLASNVAPRAAIEALVVQI